MRQAAVGWVEARLVEINRFSPEMLDPARFPNEHFELYSVPAFSAGEPELQLGSAIRSAKQLIAPQDVLICKINPRINRVWQVMPKKEHRQIGSSEWIVMRAPELEARFLRYFFTSPGFRNEICDGVIGVGGSLTRAQPKTVATFSIPIAPLKEQRRIADKLDAVLARVDSCRERLERMPAILKHFRQAVLAAATSGRLTEDWRDGRRTEEWRDVLLSDIADIQGGITKDAKKQSARDEEVPYLRVANVQRGYLDLSEMKSIRVPAGKLAGLLLQRGDVLFNEGGDRDKVGRGWVWEGQIERCTFQNHVFRARLYEKTIQPKYISWWSNYRGLDYFVRAGRQTVNLASINKSLLSNLPISLPPVEEQVEIVRRVECLFAYADRLETLYAASRARVDRLTPALLAKAFRGELVPQDPSDEPASALLERIRAARGQATDKGKAKQRPRETSIKAPRKPRGRSDVRMRA